MLLLLTLDYFEIFCLFFLLSYVTYRFQDCGFVLEIEIIPLFFFSSFDNKVSLIQSEEYIICQSS